MLEEFFLYDCRGLVLRTTNKNVVIGCAKQILKGIAILSWYSDVSPGGTFFDFKSFVSSL